MSLVSSYSTLLDARMKKIFPVVQSEVTEEYLKIANKVSWGQYQYVMSGVTGLSMGQIIADGAIPGSDAPIQGYTKTFTQAIFTQRVRLSKMSYYFLFQSKNFAKIDADLKSQVLNLKDAVTHLRNYYLQALVKGGGAAGSTTVTFTPLNGFGGSVVADCSTADGVKYWSASHAREDGGANWSNVATGAFSFANLLTTKSLHSTKKDGRGLPLMSSLDTLVFVKDSAAHYLAQSILATLQSGKYPSATPGTTGTFVDANPIPAYKIETLSNYGGLGLVAADWLAFDSTKKNDNFGFQYVESKGLELSDLREDYVGNNDLIADATVYCQMGANDLRFWMGYVA
ncbi:hypothetical protein EKK58_11180 [Candidatus Dependentiae bacterium]|nr:MAG: hypothetical protein EKK58_11180 [Candidatus Dependentiae bacterium]